MNKQSEMVPAQAPSEHGLAAVFSRLRNEIDQLFDDFTMPFQMDRLFPLPDGTNFSPLVELKDKEAARRVRKIAVG